MNDQDKRAWLEKHGRIECGPVVSSVNMYCAWESHSKFDIIKFDEKSINAIGLVYDDAKEHLFILCQNVS